MLLFLDTLLFASCSMVVSLYLFSLPHKENEEKYYINGAVNFYRSAEILIY